MFGLFPSGGGLRLHRVEVRNNEKMMCINASDAFGNVEVRKLRHISRREITNDVYLDGVLQ